MRDAITRKRAPSNGAPFIVGRMVVPVEFIFWPSADFLHSLVVQQTRSCFRLSKGCTATAHRFCTSQFRVNPKAKLDDS